MGSKERAKQFLAVSETHKHYSNIVDYTLTYFIAKAEKEGNQIADDLKKLKDTYQTEFEKAIEITEDVYCEIFSDEELDELTVLHSTPSLIKLRGLTSEIMNKVLEKYSLLFD